MGSGDGFKFKQHLYKRRQGRQPAGDSRDSGNRTSERQWRKPGSPYLDKLKKEKEAGNGPSGSPDRE